MTPAQVVTTVLLAALVGLVAWRAGRPFRDVDWIIAVALVGLALIFGALAWQR